MRITTPIEPRVMRRGLLLAAEAALLLAAMAPLPGHAQQLAANASALAAAGTAAPDTEANEAQLPTVIVTATRREEDIKDIPTSVSAIDASTLADHYVLNYDDLTRTVPGISFAAGAGPAVVGERLERVAALPPSAREPG